MRLFYVGLNTLDSMDLEVCLFCSYSSDKVKFRFYVSTICEIKHVKG
jgi:hypothetical protein